MLGIQQVQQSMLRTGQIKVKFRNHAFDPAL